MFKRKAQKKNFLEESDFQEIAELLGSAMEITADRNFLDHWNQVEIQVQLMARWRKPSGPEDEEFYRHLRALTAALLSADPRARGYAAYRSVFK